MFWSVASLLISVVALATSYLALVYTARPRVRVSLVNDEHFPAMQLVTLNFRVEMRSRLKKAVADMKLYINFTPPLEPVDVTFGADLELSDSNVRTGKGASRCLVVTGVRVSREEPVPYEDFSVRVKTPQRSGTYHGWITAFAHDSADDCGVSRFQITVL